MTYAEACEKLDVIIDGMIVHRNKFEKDIAALCDEIDKADLPEYEKTAFLTKFAMRVKAMENE